MKKTKPKTVEVSIRNDDGSISKGTVTLPAMKDLKALDGARKRFDERSAKENPTGDVDTTCKIMMEELCRLSGMTPPKFPWG